MIKQKALVSIVVPVYGTEAYLPACIDSLIRQSYSNLQIVLVDDQSPDRCPEICDTYAEKDSRILVIHQKNKGVSGARNTGIAHSEGDYIMFVDSDDELETNAIEVLINDIIEYQAHIVSASKCFVTIDGTMNSSDYDESVHIYEGDEMIKRSLDYDRYTRSLHSKLFDRGFIKDITFVESHNINEDGYFLFECYIKHPKVVQHNVSLYKYYQRENSASNGGFSAKYLDMLYFCDLKYKYICDNMPQYLEKAKDMVVRTNLLFLDVFCRSTGRQYIKAQRRCVKTVRKFRKHHHPINDHYNKLEHIVVWGLYPVYKFVFQLKYSR